MPNGRLLSLDEDDLSGQTMRSIADLAGLDVRFTADPQSSP